MQTVAFLVFSVASFLLALHLELKAKPTLLADASKKVLRPDLLTNPKFQPLDFVALASITMNMFDGNVNILQTKAEMQNRGDFCCVVFIAQLMFGVFLAATGFFVNEIFGASTLFDCLKPRSNLEHILTCLFLFCCLVWFMITSQDLHSSMQKIYILASKPAPTTRNSHLN
jgi:hypothetical protein